jgi:hypothetical protein
MNPIIFIRNWIRTHGKMSNDGLTITYNCKQLESIIQKSYKKIPSEKKVKQIIKRDIVKSIEYKKLTEREKQIALASCVAGALWFRKSLIESNYE